MFPAYDERENLIRILPQIGGFLKSKGIDYKILIIDDGSTDSTKNIPESLDNKLPIQIISHEKNKGIGRVFKTGFSQINTLSGEEDVLIILEADGTSDYTLIPEMISRISEGADIVIASRHKRGGGYKKFPLKRYLLSVLGNNIMTLFFKKGEVRDYTIFYRGYRASLIRKGLAVYGDKLITSDTFFANAELLINLSKLTENIAEVPLVYNYGVKRGSSKMPVFKTLLDYIKFIFRRFRWFNGRFGQKARFLLVGIWNTVLGYGIFLGFNALFAGVFKSRAGAYMAAIVLSNIFSIINAFIFHKHITFRSKTSGRAMVSEFFRFSCTYLVSFVLSLLLMPILVEIARVKPSIAAAVIIAVITCVSYIGHAKFSFKKAGAI